jgi:hypothetical protein
MVYNNSEIDRCNIKIKPKYIGKKKYNEYNKIICNEYHPAGNRVIAEQIQNYFSDKQKPLGIFFDHISLNIKVEVLYQNLQ